MEAAENLLYFTLTADGAPPHAVVGWQQIPLPDAHRIVLHLGTRRTEGGSATMKRRSHLITATAHL